MPDAGLGCSRGEWKDSWTLTLPHPYPYFVPIRNLWDRQRPTTTTTVTNDDTIHATRATVEQDDDDDKDNDDDNELYDDNDDKADALGCFPARRPFPRASSLASSYLDYRARSTSPSKSLHSFSRSIFPLTATSLCSVAERSGSRSRPRGQVLRR